MSGTAATLGIFSGSPLRRLRRDQVARPAFDKPDPYVQLMACWLDFMRADDRDLGASGMRLISDGVDERDVHERQRAADLKVGESVDVMVRGLPALHRWAIYKSQGIAKPWLFPNADFGSTLILAREELEKKLRKHVATQLYFL
jgi:hypothetical protein